MEESHNRRIQSQDGIIVVDKLNPSNQLGDAAVTESRMTPNAAGGGDHLISYVNTTPRRKCGPTVTSFQNTTENSPPVQAHNYKNQHKIFVMNTTSSE